MSAAEEKMQKTLVSLVEITDALLRGEYDHSTATIDTEGLLSDLAAKINTMVVNLRNVEAPLSSAGETAPNLLTKANNVVDLMGQSTSVVLDKADKVTELADKIDRLITSAPGDCKEFSGIARETINSIKAAAFDIIASQSYQDVARQKMEGILEQLSQVRNWLLEALIILNIKKDDSAENLQKKTVILQQVKKEQPGKPNQDLKQDLVDDLLAEFGF